MADYKDPENTLIMETTSAASRSSLTSARVEHQELPREHFYDGINFHRVIDGFRRPDGRIGSPSRFEQELIEEPHVRGNVSVRRTRLTRSFHRLRDARSTPSKAVIEGMENVDRSKGERTL